MSESSPSQLRIYCVCGQKMKVARDMFGKPGKCVACRQKIRVPSEEELPDSSGEIHLKDHPEFLRKPLREPVAAIEPAPVAPESVAEAAQEAVLLADEPEGEWEGEFEPVPESTSEDRAAVPFVLYDPLRAICNYESQLNEQLEALRENRKGAYDKATLMGYRGLVRKSRQHLEKRFRDALSAIATELEGLQEAIASATLALRTGDTPYLAFSKQVLPLRKRRELLVYQQHNIRGWLATEDPHMAGGQTEISLTDVPVESSETPFPLDTDTSRLPIENAVLKLEESLRQREKSDKRLNELHHMNLEGAIGADDLKRMRADCEAARERARSGVAFYRSRLQQVVQDCEDDSSALQAFQEVKKQELAVAAIAKDVYEALEEAIFRAQVDIKRARNMATRALNANAVSDVPNPRGTFLERLARPGSFRGLGADSWLAWIGSALMLAVIFVPIAANAPGGNAAVFQAFTLALFVGASALGLCATILLRIPRALALSLVWFTLTIAGAAYFQWEQHAASIAGAALRGSPPWWMSQGGLILLAGWAVAGLAAVVASYPVASIRWVGPIVLAAGGALAGFILTDFGGLLRPAPIVGTPATEADMTTGTYHVVVPLVNGGRRPYWIGGDRVGVPAATTYLLERQLGPTAWEEADPPLEVTVDGVAQPLDLKRGVEVPALSGVALHYTLAPGTYRIQLTPLWNGGAAAQQTVQLDSFEIDLSGLLTRPTPRPAPGAQTEDGSDGVPVTIELKGVVDGLDSQPKFSIVIGLPGGEEQRAQFSLGDTLHGDWRIAEFSPANNTITVTNGEKLIIVERGQVETLQ